MKKYPSIENHYRTKEIEWWLSFAPELQSEKYVLQEKIHGANIQLIFDNGKLEIATRNKVLLPGEDFYNIRRVIEFNSPLIEQFMIFAADDVVRIYGEIFGNGVQKGVDYNVARNILFFDIMIGDAWKTPEDLVRIFTDLKLESFLVPTFAYANSLKEALDSPVEFPSLINPVEGNISEGVVIKPFNKVFVSPQGSIFYLKKKNEKFNEKSKEKKCKSNPKDPKIVSLMVNFCEYINENRVQSYFSKEGEINSPKQMGQYIQGIIADAKRDFIKDHPVEAFTKDEQKEIFKFGGKTTVLILKRYL